MQARWREEVGDKILFLEQRELEREDKEDENDVLQDYLRENRHDL